MFTLVLFHFRPYNLDALSNNDIRIVDIIECSLDWLWAKIVSYIYMLSRDRDISTNRQTDRRINQLTYGLKWTDRWMDGWNACVHEYLYINGFWGFMVEWLVVHVIVEQVVKHLHVIHLIVYVHIQWCGNSQSCSALNLVNVW